MTALLIYLKHHCPRLWLTIESLNSLLFSLRYGRAESVAASELAALADGDIRLSLVEEGDIAALARLLQHQPEDYLRYFHPHAFSEQELRRLLSSRAFIMMKATLTRDGTMAGYCFLRCFCVGKAFHGFLVGKGYDGHGIGAAMMKANKAICRRLRLRLCSTVSSRNIASLRASEKASSILSKTQLRDGYMLIEWET